jgi:hypothetical protein
MEFDIGTIIYIIITIVAIAAGTLGKKRKPGQSKPAGDPEKSSGSFLENLGKQFEGLIDEAKESVKLGTTGEAEAEFEEVIEDKKIEYQTITDQYNESQAEEDSLYSDFEGEYDPDQIENEELITSEAISATEKQILEIIEIDETKYADYYEIVQDFDLGTAVIYSSIINRKEY